MRTIAVLGLVLGCAASATAAPVTWYFTGHVTQTWNGVGVFNGDTAMSGSVSFDTDIPHSAGTDGPYPDPFPVSWAIVTEGITFERDEGTMTCGCQVFDYSDTGLYTHAEYQQLHNTGTYGFDYHTFNIDFLDGVFTGGSFQFDASVGPNDLSSSLVGVIDSVSVPAPGTLGLLLAGLGLVLGTRRRALPSD